MRNKEQIRAANALDSLRRVPELNKGQQGGDALTGFPALIVGNGLLATVAFSQAKGSGHTCICDAIARHLAHKAIGLLDKTSTDATAMARELAQENSDKLRLCTAEALAFLNYLRRFAKASA